MFRKTILTNGLRVVTEKIEGTKSLTILVLVGAGSRYENQEIRGISHFLEHMFFKGAKKFKNTKEVSEAIDSVGGIFNAFTGKEYAGYFVKVASEYGEVAASVLSDMLINSKFDQAEIEKERGVILEEYNMYQDTPMYQIGWNFENLVFGDQPMGWDQIGTKELIKTVNHEDFVNYKKSLYVPNNTVIAIAGNVDHNEAVALVEKYFEMDEAKKELEFLPLEDKEGGKVSLKEKKTEQAHVAIGCCGYAETHKDHWGLKLLSVILGGNMSSRMFLGVREAKGLAYYIHTSTDSYIDGGILVTNAGVDLNRVDEAVKGIVAEYKTIVNESVPEEELKKAKSYLKGKMVLGLEDSEEFAHLLAKYELLHGEMKSPDEIMKLIDKVTVADISRIAKEVLAEEKLKIAVIGPFSDEQHFVEMLKY
ncbi:MAG: pitrilysin family protein [Candidatus Gracilibacteria bacterium]|nr:pitrilysin family protein [Candidatus Gracilibacteria bacterium]